MFACMATYWAVVLADTGLFGLSVRPGPCRKSSHPADVTASESTTAVFRYRIMSFLIRSVEECEGQDPRACERVVEPVDAAIERLRATEIRFRIVTGIIRPQREVASRQLHVDLAHA